MTGIVGMAAEADTVINNTSITQQLPPRVEHGDVRVTM